MIVSLSELLKSTMDDRTVMQLEVGVTRQRNLMHQNLLQHILVHAQAAQQVGTRAHADEL